MAVFLSAVMILTSFSSPAFSQTPFHFAQDGIMVPNGTSITQASSATTLLESIQIPPELGWINVKHAGVSKRLVIHLEDAHSIPEAQKNLFALTQYLSERYSIPLVLLEGAEGSLDPLLLKTFPLKSRQKELIESYLESGELSGAALASLSTHGTQFVGIEDWKLYEKETFEFQKALEVQKLELVKIQAIDAQLESLISNHQKIQKYWKVLKQWSSKEKHFESVLRYLKEETSSKDLTSLPRLKLFAENIQISDAEKAAVTKEINQWVSEIPIKPFNRSQTKEWNQKLQAWRTGQIDISEMAAFLDSISHQDSVRYSNRLKNFMELSRRIEGLKGSELFQEIERAFFLIRSRLPQNDEEKSLLRVAHSLLLAEKMLLLELTPAEWRQVQHDFKTLQTPENKFDIESSREAFFKQPELGPFIAFYQIAEKRDQILHKRTLELMGETKSQAAILVTGGFHTQTLSEQMRSSGGSYLSITPAIQKIPESSIYSKLMSGNVSWKKYFTEKKGVISLYDAFMQSAADELIRSLPFEKVIPTVRQWRDNLLRELAHENRLNQAQDYTRFVDQSLKFWRDSFRAEYESGWRIELDRLIRGIQNLILQKNLDLAHVQKLFPKSSTVPFTAVASFVPRNKITSSLVHHSGSRNEVRAAELEAASAPVSTSTKSEFEIIIDRAIMAEETFLAGLPERIKRGERPSLQAFAPFYDELMQRMRAVPQVPDPKKDEENPPLAQLAINEQVLVILSKIYAGGQLDQISKRKLVLEDESALDDGHPIWWFFSFLNASKFYFEAIRARDLRPEMQSIEGIAANPDRNVFSQKVLQNKSSDFHAALTMRWTLEFGGRDLTWDWRRLNNPLRYVDIPRDSVDVAVNMWDGMDPAMRPDVELARFICRNRVSKVVVVQERSNLPLILEIFFKDDFQDPIEHRFRAHLFPGKKFKEGEPVRKSIRVALLDAPLQPQGQGSELLFLTDTASRASINTLHDTAAGLAFNETSNPLQAELRMTRLFELARQKRLLPFSSFFLFEQGLSRQAQAMTLTKEERLAYERFYRSWLVAYQISGAFDYLHTQPDSEESLRASLEEWAHMRQFGLFQAGRDPETEARLALYRQMNRHEWLVPFASIFLAQVSTGGWLIETPQRKELTSWCENLIREWSRPEVQEVLSAVPDDAKHDFYRELNRIAFELFKTQNKEKFSPKRLGQIEKRFEKTLDEYNPSTDGEEVDMPMAPDPESLLPEREAEFYADFERPWGEDQVSEMQASFETILSTYHVRNQQARLRNDHIPVPSVHLDVPATLPQALRALSAWAVQVSGVKLTPEQQAHAALMSDILRFSKAMANQEAEEILKVLRDLRTHHSEFYQAHRARFQGAAADAAQLMASDLLEKVRKESTHDSWNEEKAIQEIGVVLNLTEDIDSVQSERTELSERRFVAQNVPLDPKVLQQNPGDLFSRNLFHVDQLDQIIQSARAHQPSFYNWCASRIDRQLSVLENLSQRSAAPKPRLNRKARKAEQEVVTQSTEETDQTALSNRYAAMSFLRAVMEWEEGETESVEKRLSRDVAAGVWAHSENPGWRILEARILVNEAPNPDLILKSVFGLGRPQEYLGVNWGEIRIYQRMFLSLVDDLHISERSDLAKRLIEEAQQEMPSLFSEHPEAAWYFIQFEEKQIQDDAIFLAKVLDSDALPKSAANWDTTTKAKETQKIRESLAEARRRVEMQLDEGHLLGPFEVMYLNDLAEIEIIEEMLDAKTSPQGASYSAPRLLVAAGHLERAASLAHHFSQSLSDPNIHYPEDYRVQIRHVLARQLNQAGQMSTLFALLEKANRRFKKRAGTNGDGESNYAQVESQVGQAHSDWTVVAQDLGMLSRPPEMRSATESARVNVEPNHVKKVRLSSEQNPLGTEITFEEGIPGNGNGHQVDFDTRNQHGIPNVWRPVSEGVTDLPPEIIVDAGTLPAGANVISNAQIYDPNYDYLYTLWTNVPVRENGVKLANLAMEAEERLVQEGFAAWPEGGRKVPNPVFGGTFSSLYHNQMFLAGIPSTVWVSVPTWADRPWTGNHSPSLTEAAENLVSVAHHYQSMGLGRYFPAIISRQRRLIEYPDGTQTDIHLGVFAMPADQGAYGSIIFRDGNLHFMRSLDMEAIRTMQAIEVTELKEKELDLGQQMSLISLRAELDQRFVALNPEKRGENLAEIFAMLVYLFELRPDEVEGTTVSDFDIYGFDLLAKDNAASGSELSGLKFMGSRERKSKVPIARFIRDLMTVNIQEVLCPAEQQLHFMEAALTHTVPVRVSNPEVALEAIYRGLEKKYQDLGSSEREARVQAKRETLRWLDIFSGDPMSEPFRDRVQNWRNHFESHWDTREEKPGHAAPVFGNQKGEGEPSIEDLRDRLTQLQRLLAQRPKQKILITKLIEYVEGRIQKLTPKVETDLKSPVRRSNPDLILAPRSGFGISAAGGDDVDGLFANLGDRLLAKAAPGNGAKSGKSRRSEIRNHLYLMSFVSLGAHLAVNRSELRRELTWSDLQVRLGAGMALKDFSGKVHRNISTILQESSTPPEREESLRILKEEREWVSGLGKNIQITHWTSSAPTSVEPAVPAIHLQGLSVSNPGMALSDQETAQRAADLIGLQSMIFPWMKLLERKSRLAMGLLQRDGKIPEALRQEIFHGLNRVEAILENYSNEAEAALQDIQSHEERRKWPKAHRRISAWDEKWRYAAPFENKLKEFPADQAIRLRKEMKDSIREVQKNYGNAPGLSSEDVIEELQSWIDPERSNLLTLSRIYEKLPVTLCFRGGVMEYLLPSDRPRTSPQRLIFTNDSEFKLHLVTYGTTKTTQSDLDVSDGALAYLVSSNPADALEKLSTVASLAQTADDTRQGATFLGGAHAVLVAKEGSSKKNNLRRAVASLVHAKLLGEDVALSGGTGLNQEDMDQASRAAYVAGISFRWRHVSGGVTFQNEMSRIKMWIYRFRNFWYQHGWSGERPEIFSIPPILGVSEKLGGIPKGKNPTEGTSIVAAMLAAFRNSVVKNEFFKGAWPKTFRGVVIGNSRIAAQFLDVLSGKIKPEDIRIVSLLGPGRSVYAGDGLSAETQRQFIKRVSEEKRETLEGLSNFSSEGVQVTEYERNDAEWGKALADCEFAVIASAPGTFTRELAAKFKGKVVFEAIPYSATEEAIQELEERGVLFIPSTSVNVGTAYQDRQEVLYQLMPDYQYQQSYQVLDGITGYVTTNLERALLRWGAGSVLANGRRRPFSDQVRSTNDAIAGMNVLVMHQMDELAFDSFQKRGLILEDADFSRKLEAIVTRGNIRAANQGERRRLKQIKNRMNELFESGREKRKPIPYRMALRIAVFEQLYGEYLSGILYSNHQPEEIDAHMTALIDQLLAALSVQSSNMEAHYRSRNAAYLLGQIPLRDQDKTRVVGPLVEAACKHPYRQVQAEAAKALGRLGLKDVPGQYLDVMVTQLRVDPRVKKWREWTLHRIPVDWERRLNDAAREVASAQAELANLSEDLREEQNDWRQLSDDAILKLAREQKKYGVQGAYDKLAKAYLRLGRMQRLAGNNNEAEKNIALALDYFKLSGSYGMFFLVGIQLHLAELQEELGNQEQAYETLLNCLIPHRLFELVGIYDPGSGDFSDGSPIPNAVRVTFPQMMFAFLPQVIEKIMLLDGVEKDAAEVLSLKFSSYLMENESFLKEAYAEAYGLDRGSLNLEQKILRNFLNSKQYQELSEDPAFHTRDYFYRVLVLLTTGIYRGELGLEKEIAAYFVKKRMPNLRDLRIRDWNAAKGLTKILGDVHHVNRGERSELRQTNVQKDVSRAEKEVLRGLLGIQPVKTEVLTPWIENVRRHPRTLDDLKQGFEKEVGDLAMDRLKQETRGPFEQGLIFYSRHPEFAAAQRVLLQESLSQIEVQMKSKVKTDYSFILPADLNEAGQDWVRGLLKLAVLYPLSQVHIGFLANQVSDTGRSFLTDLKAFEEGSRIQIHVFSANSDVRKPAAMMAHRFLLEHPNALVLTEDSAFQRQVSRFQALHLDNLTLTEALPLFFKLLPHTALMEKITAEEIRELQKLFPVALTVNRNGWLEMNESARLLVLNLQTSRQISTNA